MRETHARGEIMGASWPGYNFDIYTSFITQNLQLGITPTITIPMIQYINKESPFHCSYPKSVYPNQQAYNPYVHPNGDDCVSCSYLLLLSPLLLSFPFTPFSPHPLVLSFHILFQLINFFLFFSFLLFSFLCAF